MNNLYDDMLKQSLKTPSFRDSLFFCSNMAPCTIIYKNITFPSSENLYQSFKTSDINHAILFSKMTPVESKKAGKKIEEHFELPCGFKANRLKIMQKVLKLKFEQNKDLRDLLIISNDIELVERNNWNDTFWGFSKGNGENHLGRLLMEERQYYLNLLKEPINLSI